MAWDQRMQPKRLHASLVGERQSERLRQSLGNTRNMVVRRTTASIIFVSLILLSALGTNLFGEYIMSAKDAEGDFTRQVLVLGLFGTLLFVQAINAGSRPVMAIPKSLLILLGYCLLSVTWAVEPTISFRRLALTAVVIWMIVRCVGDLGIVRTVSLLRWTLLVIVVLSYLAVIFTDYGVHGASLDEADSVLGDWRGILPHKNNAGVVCAFSILLFLFDRRNLSPLFCGTVISANLYFLWNTHSKTSLALCLMLGAIGWIIGRYNPRYRSWLWPVGMTVMVAGSLLIAYNIDAILVFLNDPGALTGRGAIWTLLMEYARENPWTGAGFGSFWQIGANSPILLLNNGWIAQLVSHGHNGYFDLLITIGAPGLVLAVFVTIIWPLLLLFWSHSISGPRRALLSVIILFCAFHNLTETSLMDRVSTVQVMLMIAIILVHRMAAQSEGRHQMLKRRLSSAWQRARGKPIGSQTVGRVATARPLPPKEDARISSN